MAGRMSNFTIPCRGGLNLTNNNHELLKKPNEAIALVNFECSIQGGYRRISGYQEFGTVSTGTDPSLGIKNYKGRIVVNGPYVGTSTIQHSFDGTYWLDITKNLSTYGNEAALTAAPALPLRLSGRYMFTEHDSLDVHYVIATDGINNPVIISIKGNDRASAEYRIAEIALGDDLTGVRCCEMFKNQLILGGSLKDPTSFYYSSHATTDLDPVGDADKEIPQEKFDGATSGAISVGEPIVGLKVHRETLYVFCENSIHKVQGLDSGQAVVQPVTRDIGCLDGFSIQEIGGDLLFLAPDGLRTIAKTERNDDVELGVISRKISPLIDRYLRSSKVYEVNTTVVRAKNQYRLWFTDRTEVDASQKGFIASYTFDNNTGAFSWDFSELEGMGVSCVDNSRLYGEEIISHGGLNGKNYVQEQGNTFDGRRIRYRYQTPYTDFGDYITRKNIHKVDILTKPEGNVRYQMDIRYDFDGIDVHHPDTYVLEPLALPAIFGDPLTVFGSVTYGARGIPSSKAFAEGSGKTVSFRFESTREIDDAPFDIQSLIIDLTTGGKI